MRGAAWLLVCVLTAACATESPGASPDREASSSPTPRPSATAPAKPVATRDWEAHRFRPVTMDRSPRGEKFFHRARDGSTLVTFGNEGSHPRLWTRYRIYGPDWKPRSPLLKAQVDLEITGALDDSFVGEATVLDSGAATALHEHVVVSPAGTLRRLPLVREKSPIQRRDEVYVTQAGRTVAFRQATGRVHRVERAATSPPGSASPWFLSEDGDACAVAHRRGRTFLYWTFDQTRTWRSLDTTGLLPAFPQPFDCAARRDRVVLVAEAGVDDPARVHTIVVTGPRVVSSYRLNRQFESWDRLYAYKILADGRVVFWTPRQGVMVANNRLNSQFEFRRAPVRDGTEVEVVGNDLVAQNWGERRDLLDVSSDGGLTWRVVDLKAGSWTAPAG